jgi:hypothetical protein
MNPPARSPAAPPFEGAGPVPCFAVSLASRPTDIDGILLMVEDRQEAEEIAIELRRKGHHVTVRELAAPPERASSLESTAH